MEVQAHGNAYEDHVIRGRTGMSKDEYDALKPNGYTSEFDLSKGLVVDYNGSIKTTSSNTICCSDVVRKMTHINYRLIVGQYTQVGKEKVFHTEYEFFITPDDGKALWGKMDIQEVREFVDYVKSIPFGEEAQCSTKPTRQMLQEQAQDSSALFKLNPKVDSKKQRRVQCSLKISELIAAGIKYEQRSVDYQYLSARRKFKKKS